MTDLATLLTLVDADPVARAHRAAGRRPRVGTSACLAGEPVRYDATDRRVAPVADLLAAVATLVPLCPEMAIGLGAPRPTLQRVRLDDGREVVRGVLHRVIDVSDRLDDYAAEVVRAHAGEAQRLHGYVFKARSPSCAPGSAPLFDAEDRPLGTGWGRYAGRLRAAWPDLPMCDEEAVATMPGLAAFVIACYRAL